MSSQHVTTRKKRRGMIEKRRRDKINNSLCELRRLVPAAFEKQGSAKLEKAEILQMTVDYLRMLHARGLADSLTNNKQLPLQTATGATNDESPSTQPLAQASNTSPIVMSQQQTHQRQHHQQQQQQSVAQSTTLALSQHQSNHLHQHQQSLDQHHHHHHQALAASAAGSQSSAATAAAMAVSASSPSHHLYNQHHMASAAAVAAAEHATAAAYHHHLSNPLGADMTGMMTHANSAAQQSAQHQAAMKHSMIKMDSHQPSLVIQQSHAGLLNLDHHHQAHHAHNPLSVHYGSHPNNCNPNNMVSWIG